MASYGLNVFAFLLSLLDLGMVDGVVVGNFGGGAGRRPEQASLGGPSVSASACCYRLGSTQGLIRQRLFWSSVFIKGGIFPPSHYSYLVLEKALECPACGGPARNPQTILGLGVFSLTALTL